MRKRHNWGRMQEAHHVRIFSDDLGESHFEDVSTSLTPADFAPPAPPLNFARLFRATDCGFLGVPSEWAGDVPHPSPRRQLFCILEGKYVVTASDESFRILQPGSVLLLEDTSGKGHSTRIVGPNEGLILAIGLAD
jgi:hypothetical protein